MQSAAAIDCPDGGLEINVGLDNGDGGGTSGDSILDAGEVDQTSFVCNGADGFSTLVLVSEEAAGANCAIGGTRIDAGLDNGDGGETADDGILGAGEIDQSSFLCDSPPAPATIPLVHMKFNNDLENSGSVGGTATGSTSGFTTDNCGNDTGAASFNTNAVSTPSVALTSGNFTFSAWIRTTDASDFNGIVAQPDPFANGLLQLFLRTGGLYHSTYISPTPSGGRDIIAGAVNDDEWHHLLTTINSATEEHISYLDGVEVDNIAPASTTDHVYTGSIFIGRLRDISGSYTGLIDNVRIYDSAISPEEVATLFAFEAATCSD